MQRLIECVPNFSEGRDADVLKQITDAIESVSEVRLLDVDPGKATNRTVVTFVGEPEPVIEAAVRGARKAAELIDMSQHAGEHPRFGGMDVCPLVPVSGVTMDETVQYARELARRLGEEAGLSIFCYEAAAFSEERRNLATVREGEYEGLEEKLADPRWTPDFGPAAFQPRTGATAVGARDFLIAYNVNLNTTSTRRANAVAFDVRERGRKKRDGDPLTGPVVRDANGDEVWSPGALRCVKAIGWYIEEYGIAQISMNLTDTSVTPLHLAFDTCCVKAQARGLRVTGSEIVGMVPLRALLDAGRYFLIKQQRSLGIPDDELVKIAVRTMGLDELTPFDPDEKIIEYALRDGTATKLVDLSLTEFANATAAESPAPGGGSVAAALGALAAALGTMVANLSAHKRGWDSRWEEFSEHAVTGKALQERLLRLVDEDTDAFGAIASAFRLPRSTDGERAARKSAIETATRGAIETPLRTMEASLATFDLLEAMVASGLPASLSDAGVGVLCARAAVRGACLNVRTNAKELTDHAAARDYVEQAEAIEREAADREERLLATVSAAF